MFWKALACWFLLLVVAVTSGGLREKLLKPRMGELRAHQVGTFLVCIVFGALIVAFARWTAMGPSQAAVIGCIWTAMTVAFEVSMVRVWMKKPWSAVFADYNLRRGRVWILVLLTTLAGP
ncbi:MAG: hypothetical protein KJ060_16730, partial [Candidatus Hydrogenedentes bacterium]|nr:hypothetical protein [Candidatus Hydrogenedentota bacterium]